MTVTLEKDISKFYVLSGQYSGYSRVTYNGSTINRASHWNGNGSSGLALSIDTFTGSFQKGKTISFGTAAWGSGIIY